MLTIATRKKPFSKGKNYKALQPYLKSASVRILGNGDVTYSLAHCKFLQIDKVFARAFGGPCDMIA